MSAEFPRVDIPDADPEAIAAFRDELDTAKAEALEAATAIQYNRQGMVSAMIRRGYKPYLGHVFRPKRKTTHVRSMERRKAAGAVIRARKEATA